MGVISRQIKCDVLVAGGGGAGIRSALSAAEEGRDVLLLGEAPPGRAGSSFYPLSFEWGMLYAADEEDAEAFYDEIVTASGGCLDKRLARMLAFGSTEAHQRMAAEGVPFVPMKDVGITGCFGREPRGAFLGDWGALIAAWNRRLQDMDHIRVQTGMTVVSLLADRGKCHGVIAVDAAGDLLQLEANAVILALGGGEGLYEYGTSYGRLWGASYAMAARQGARLVNLEFIQFVHGTVSPVRGMNYYPFSYRELPRVTNQRGEACLGRYLPEGVSEEDCLLAHASHGPFSTDSVGRYFEYAMVGEAEKGNGVGLTVTPWADRVSAPRYRLWNRFLGKQGLEASTPMALYPFAQGFNGGIFFREDMRTDLEGLFACGESAGGCHGPNRMGGLCILATQVFGEAAGKAAAAYAARTGQNRGMAEGLERVSSPGTADTAEEVQRHLDQEFHAFEDGAELTPGGTLSRIRCIMQRYGCLHRSDEGLSQAIKEVERLCIRPLAHLHGAETAEWFRVYNAADAARLILYSMKQRKESRGCHDRRDYPSRDAWQEQMNWVSFREGRVAGGPVQ